MAQVTSGTYHQGEITVCFCMLSGRHLNIYKEEEGRGLKTPWTFSITVTCEPLVVQSCKSRIIRRGGERSLSPLHVSANTTVPVLFCSCVHPRTVETAQQFCKAYATRLSRVATTTSGKNPWNNTHFPLIFPDILVTVNYNFITPLDRYGVSESLEPYFAVQILVSKQNLIILYNDCIEQNDKQKRKTWMCAWK